MIFVIDDDKDMAACIKRACRKESIIFTNAIDAMSEIASGTIPDLIFLDILLDGPDGFTFLNELVSYSDTAKIPVVVTTSLDLSRQNLSSYGVVAILHEDTMLPKDIKKYADEYAK